jgi:hypothetical protein
LGISITIFILDLIFFKSTGLPLIRYIHETYIKKSKA